MQNNTEIIDNAPDNSVRAKYKKPYLYSAALSLLFAIAAAILYNLAYMRQYDALRDHFDAGSPLFIAAMCCVGAAFVPVVACLAAMYKKADLRPATVQNTPVIFLCALCGFMQLTFGVMRLIDLFTYGGFTALETARCVVAIAASAYFFLSASAALHDKPVMTLVGFLVPAYYVLSLMSVYFSNALALNSPQKILAQVSFVSLALFFTAECRVGILRMSLSKYYFFGSASVITSTLSWLPQLIQTVSGKVAYTFSLLECALACSVTLYIIARLSTASNLLCAYVPEPKPEKKKKSGAK